MLGSTMWLAKDTFVPLALTIGDANNYRIKHGNLLLQINTDAYAKCIKSIVMPSAVIITTNQLSHRHQLIIFSMLCWSYAKTFSFVMKLTTHLGSVSKTQKKRTFETTKFWVMQDRQPFKQHRTVDGWVG